MLPSNLAGPSARRSSLVVSAFLILAPVTVIAQAEPSFYEARVAPIFEQHCVTCHGSDKSKGKLRLDSFEGLQHGGESGEVVVAGEASASELFRRISLPLTDEDIMPSDGKPQLSRTDIKVIELWLNGGASLEKPVSAFPDAPPPKAKPAPPVPLTPDWSSHGAELVALAKQLGIKLAPRSVIARDGLVLRTASSPSRCTDETLAKLAPYAEFIVEAELARTKVTDAGLQTLGRWKNLRSIDLTHTAVTSQGISHLTALEKLERLNLTATAVDDDGIRALQSLPLLQHTWAFGSKVVEAK